MPDHKLPPLTPIPPGDFHAVARNLNAIGQSVAGIEANVTAIRQDILPPVAEAAREARDGVLRLDGRVRSLESTPPPPHTCTEGDRQARQDAAIAAGDQRGGQTSKLLWWLLALLVAVGSSAIGFAMVVQTTAAKNSTTISNVGESLVRHEAEIKALEKAQAADRQTYLRELRALPRRVQETAPPVEQVGDAVDGLPLRPSERRQIIRLLELARERQGNGDG